MADLWVVKRPDGALEVLPESVDEGRKIGVGEVLRVKYTRPRNGDHHRKFFALLQVVLENQEHFVNIDQILIDFKIRTGHVDVFIRQNGEVVYVPKSISFARMDQAGFEKFYQSVLDTAVREYVKGCDPRELDRAAMEIINFM